GAWFCLAHFSVTITSAFVYFFTWSSLRSLSAQQRLAMIHFGAIFINLAISEYRTALKSMFCSTFVAVGSTTS
ncbi:hypothetical protein PMAYCL1PPCAC_04024, partial [Pristionchus mayeri]